jgi:nucleoside-diphosphate-sugar epimerase
VKALVTGGGGFLGSHLVKALLDRGYDVTSFSRGHYPKVIESGAKEFRGDIQNYGEIKKAIEGKDVVFHVAGKVGVWGPYKEYFNINVIGTENIVRACKECGVKKLVFTSSPSVVFGKSHLENADETQPYPEEYVFHYGKTKAMAEKIVMDGNDEQLATISIRPHLIFGPGDQNLFPRVVKSARDGKLKIVGDGDNLVDVIYVDNAVVAHLKAFDSLEINGKTSGKTYFVGQEEPVKLWSLINQILESHGLEPLRKKIGVNSAYRIGAVLEGAYKILGIKKDPPMTRFIAMQLGKSHYFNHSNAKSDFNFTPTIDLETALKRTLPQRNDIKQENSYAH